MESARETAKDFLKFSAAKGLQLSRELENQHFALGNACVLRVSDGLYEVTSDDEEAILVNHGSELLDAINRSAKLMNLKLFE